MDEKLIEGMRHMNQFVGHNSVESIKSAKMDDETSITYCDCLYNNQYLVINKEDMN